MKKIGKNLLIKLGVLNPRIKNPWALKVYTMPKAYLLMSAIRNLERTGIKGSIVECGIGFGDSFSLLCWYAQQTNRKVYAFDSFAGFPEIEEAEAQTARAPKKGEVFYGGPEEIKEKLLNIGISADFISTNIKFVRGNFEDTLSDDQLLDLPEIALLNLDVDLGASYRVCLSKLYEKVVSGGVVSLDEYRDPKWPEATKEIDAFIGKVSVDITIDPLFGNRGFIVKD